MRLLLGTSVTSFNIPFTQKHSSSLSWIIVRWLTFVSLCKQSKIRWTSNLKPRWSFMQPFFFASSNNFPPCGVEHCITKSGCVEDYRSGTFSVLFCQKTLQGGLKNDCSLKLLPTPSQIKNNWPWSLIFFPFSFQPTKLSFAAFSLTFTNGTRFLPSSQISRQMFCVAFCTISIPAVCRGTWQRTRQRS